MAKKKQSEEPAILHSAIADEFDVRDDLPVVFACAEFGRVDLREVKDIEFARQLAQLGYLKKRV